MTTKTNQGSSISNQPRRTLLVDAAVAACILAARVASAADQSTAATASENANAGAELAEITVTAERRTENLQDVPITIQALNSDTLQELHIDNFEDMAKFLPNVTVSGTGPGQSNIYMRGLSVGQTGIQGSGGVGQFPNVAVYLDEQSGQLPDRNLDIYAADIERVEVLEGPQGTLFGAGAQAGVVRYITNKPKLDTWEGGVNAGYALTTGGDPSTNVDAMLNVPVIPGVLAVRAVVYDDTRGGYINNIPSTFARAPTDQVITGYFGGVVPPNSGPIHNSAVVGNGINPVTYRGGRLEALWQINDDWNALVTEAVQNMDAQGVAWEEAYDGQGKTLPDLSVALFNPNYDKDYFEDTQLTVNGRVGALKLVYSGGFLIRRINEVADYTNYSRGTYAGYYQCNYPGYPFIHNPATGKNVATPGSAGYCYSPSGFWTDHQSSTHQSHELRLSTPDDWRLRGLVGLFFENETIHEQTDWFYGTSPNFIPVAPPAGSNSNNPNPRPPGDMFFDDITRGYKQKAAFTSIDFDLIPKQLTLTFGTRWYNIDDFERGSNVGSFGCEIFGPYNGGVPAFPCGIQDGSNGNNLTAQALDKTYAGFKSRANLTWHITPDAMVYYTWSQGFRPGGFNRGQTVLRPSSPLFGIWKPDVAFGPDTLINNEIGWKTEWFDHRLQLNGAIYQEIWQNVQLGIFDPSVTGNLTFDTNGPNFRVRGAEFSAIVVPTRGLTVTASASFNSSQTTSNLSLVQKNGQPIPEASNPFGPLGTPLAQSPPFQGNIRARYEFPLGDYNAFGQIGINHTGGSYSTTNFLQNTLQGLPQRFYDPQYTTWDMAVGVGKGSWKAQLYGENLNNQRGLQYATYTQYVKSDFIIRPQTYGLRFSYVFKEK